MDSCSRERSERRQGGRPGSLGDSAFSWASDTSRLPHVTVVIPAHNMELYVERALRSAVGQSYANLDVLVIDDGSTDRTREVIEAFARRHPNVRAIATNNAGVAAARNLGLELAASPFVAFLDADDLWAGDKIEKQVAALNAHGANDDWAACYTLYRMIDEHDAIIDNGPSSEERGDFFDHHLEWNHVGNGSSLLVRREAALAVGGFDAQFVPCEDYEFQLKLLKRYKMELVKEYSVGYRIHPAQTSRDLLRMRLSRVSVIEHITETMGISERKKKRLLAQSYLMIAQSFVTVRAWGNALRWIWGAVNLSPAESALRVRRRIGRDMRAFLQRITKGRRRVAQRLFQQLDASDGLGTSSAVSARQFSPLLAEARARTRPTAG